MPLSETTSEEAGMSMLKIIEGLGESATISVHTAQKRGVHKAFDLLSETGIDSAQHTFRRTKIYPDTFRDLSLPAREPGLNIVRSRGQAASARPSSVSRNAR